MQFDIEHDWQGNISTPRARVGERAKTRLLILLCAIWLLVGLIGHEPWKSFESNAVSTIKSVIENSELLTPTAASQSQLSAPPLYYLSAALTSSIFASVLPMHDGARIASGLWMLITLLMIGMTGRELLGRGYGRQTTFVFIGTTGLILSAHTISVEVAALSASASAFYALALANRRPYRASVLLAAALAVSFLSAGLLPFSIIVISCMLLPIFPIWRTKRFGSVMTIASIISLILIGLWLGLAYHYKPHLVTQWWSHSIQSLAQHNYLYFINLMLWYAWPALPLTLWAVWRYRTSLLTDAKFQLSLTYLIVAFVMIGTMADTKDIYALPLLVPLTLLASSSIDSLKRGAANALNWFSLMLFGFVGFFIWLGWNAMMTGSPDKLKERMIFLSGLEQLDFSMIAFAAASAITLVWLFFLFRSQQSNRSTATNWAIGMTFAWTLLMSLWLPMIDSARSYQDVFHGITSALPKQFSCINSQGLGSAQQDLMHYYTGIKTYPIKTGQLPECDVFLIQDDKHPKKVYLHDAWQQVWQGKRPAERKESFRLFLLNP